MIISASRRTDIPAFYTPWFINRLREGFVLVRNPLNYHQVSRVSLAPEVVDGIVFWSKNPAPLLPYLEDIGRQYPFYLQFTLNGYGREVEPGLPALSNRLATMRQLGGKWGPDRVVWRYDPVLLSPKYDVNWHKQCFARIAAELAGMADTCVFSILDEYQKIAKNIQLLGARTCTAAETEELAENFAASAAAHGIRLQTCAETTDLAKYGIEHGSCIDDARLSRLCGFALAAKKDRNQRAECGCVESIDIGQYNTCRHGCKYCYANLNPQSVIALSGQHNTASPLLTGEIEAGDKISERRMKSQKTVQANSTEQLLLGF